VTERSELFAWQNISCFGSFYHVKNFFQGAADGVSQPQVKAQTQVRASQKLSNVTCTCCWIL